MTAQPASPSATTTAAWDAAFVLKSGKGLPVGDIVTSDPYLVVKFGKYATFKTHHVIQTLNPVWDETVKVFNLPAETHVAIDVFDKDRFSRDDRLGGAHFTFNPQVANGAQEVEWHLELPITQPNGRFKGSITIEVKKCKASGVPVGPVRLGGPVKYKRHTCAIAGVLTNPICSVGTHFTYRLGLFNAGLAFGGRKKSWNDQHAAAQSIFSTEGHSAATRGAIRLQHRTMYLTDHRTLCGKCHNAADFFTLLGYDGRPDEMQRRYTYVIMEDGMWFSETGAAFFPDILSKHAMHANASEEVYFAGEFTIEPSDTPGNDLGHKLCIDNNSGTYAPPADRLPMLKELFVSNFTDMEVEALDFKSRAARNYKPECRRC